MYCTQCGTPIPDAENRCPGCGQAISLPPNAPPLAHIINEPQAEKRHTNQIWKSKIVWIALACVLVLACAISIPAIVKSVQYEEALSLMDTGEAEQAKEAFLKLQGYKEADELAQQCQNQLDYAAAKAKMDDGDYTAAKRAFAKLGNYGEAAAMAEECENALAYESAVALMDANRNSEAREAFLKLGSYKDSSELATECQNKSNYDTAKLRMENGEYAEALAMFDALGDYSDAGKLGVSCQQNIDYIAADQAYGQGMFYTAYVMFKSLGTFEDSAARADACVQAYPDTGELYRNEDYSSKRCSLTIVTADDGYPTFLKIYTEDDVLVSMLFITSGDKARVKLPVGTYKMKCATGTDWFGTEEMFGDDGNYQVLTFGDGAITASLESSYIYTLTLRSAEDGNVGTQDVGRSGF